MCHTSLVITGIYNKCNQGYGNIKSRSHTYCKKVINGLYELEIDIIIKVFSWSGAGTVLLLRISRETDT